MVAVEWSNYYQPTWNLVLRCQLKLAFWVRTVQWIFQEKEIVSDLNTEASYLYTTQKMPVFSSKR